MVFGFFKRGRDKEIENIQKILQNSFSNMREDMGKVTTWINHFHDKHNKHDESFDKVSRRLDKVEFALAELQTVILESSVMLKGKKEVMFEEEEEDSEPELSEDGDAPWMELTETQQKLCWKIAALQKEMPNEWVSLKTIAQDMYPEKDYASVRSTICQFVSQLEEMGFIKRRRKGRQTYVSSTEKNPYKDKVKKKVTTKVVMKKKVVHD